jgi:hypothetical protein
MKRKLIKVQCKLCRMYMMDWEIEGKTFTELLPAYVQNLCRSCAEQEMKHREWPCAKCGHLREQHCSFDEPGVDHAMFCPSEHHEFKEKNPA